MNDIVYAGRHSITLDVSRHIHTSWELVYCTSGSGTFHFDSQTLPYVQGDVVVIPPLTPHANRSDEGFTNIHLNLADTVLSFAAPVLIKDDGNGFILDAFNAAYFHYQKRQREPLLLSAYGSLIAALILTARVRSAATAKSSPRSKTRSFTTTLTPVLSWTAISNRCPSATTICESCSKRSSG